MFLVCAALMTLRRALNSRDEDANSDRARSLLYHISRVYNVAPGLQQPRRTLPTTV